MIGFDDTRCSPTRKTATDFSVAVRRKFVPLKSSRGGTRTPDRVINSHLLYLAELPGNIDGRRRRLTQPRTAMQEPNNVVISPD